MSGVQTIDVGAGEDGMRLDRFLRTRFPDMPHGRMQKALRKGEIRVDGGRVKADFRVAAGQKVRIPPYEPADPKGGPARQKGPDPKDEAFAKSLVIFRNRDLLAIDKPSGLAVQGGSKTERHLDGMLDFLRFGEEERPRLVHRLDKDTSGVMLLARRRETAAALSRALQRRDVKKIYWAVTVGVPDPSEGTIRMPLSKQGSAGGERVVPDPDDGQSAVTDFVVLDQAAQRAALVALWPRTGRTHQIRAHLAYLGTPVLGDGKYGGKAAFPPGDELPKGLHLHARMIELPPGVDGAGARITASPSAHMKKTLTLFEFETEPAMGEDPFDELAE